MHENHAAAFLIRNCATGTILCAILFAFGLPILSQGRAQTALKIEEVKFDEFEDLTADDAQARLDLFARKLVDAPNLRGVIAGYRREDLRPGFSLREIYGYQNYLVNSRGVDSQRLKVIDGGVKKTSTAYVTTQLWLVSAWAKDPVVAGVLAEVKAPREFDSLSLGDGCVSEYTLMLEEPVDALKFFAAALSQKPEAKGFILVHPSIREPLSRATRLAGSSRELLIREHRLAPDRIFAGVEARRHCSEIELWLAPANLVIPPMTSAGVFFQSQLMTEAEQNIYTVRRVMLVGHTYTRDNVIRRRLIQNEGDIFRRSLLEQSLKSVSKLRNFRRVGIQDVEVHLNREDKTIDFVINLIELTSPRKSRTP